MISPSETTPRRAAGCPFAAIASTANSAGAPMCAKPWTMSYPRISPKTTSATAFTHRNASSAWWRCLQALSGSVLPRGRTCRTTASAWAAVLAADRTDVAESNDKEVVPHLQGSAPRS